MLTGSATYLLHWYFSSPVHIAGGHVSRQSCDTGAHSRALTPDEARGHLSPVARWHSPAVDTRHALLAALSTRSL